MEDDDAAAVAFRAALDEPNVQVAVEPVAATSFGIPRGMYAGVERRTAVFLDLNLPPLDGWQVLVAISQDEQLRSIPGVVLSTSFRDSHIQLAYALNAKHYISKPSSLEQLLADVTEVYWQLTAVASHSIAQAVTNDATSPLQFGRFAARKNTGGSVSRSRS